MEFLWNIDIKYKYAASRREFQFKCWEIKLFSKWVLGIGNGTIGESNDVDIHVDMSNDLLIKIDEESVATMVNCTYSGFLHNINDPSFFSR